MKVTDRAVTVANNQKLGCLPQEVILGDARDSANIPGSELVYHRALGQSLKCIGCAELDSL